MHGAKVKNKSSNKKIKKKQIIMTRRTAQNLNTAT